MKQFKNKIGRNELCPCGSGKKYKHCHGFIDNSFPDIDEQNGIVVKDYTSKEVNTYILGSQGTELRNFSKIEGNKQIVFNRIDNYNIVINVDIPVFLPLEDDFKYSIQYLDNNYNFFHTTKKPGEEYYSTIDTKKFPFFSSLQIQGYAFVDITDEVPYSYQLIVYIIKRINSFLPTDHKIEIDDCPILSYHILYYPRQNFPDSPPELKITYPYSGTINIQGPLNKPKIDNDSLSKFLSESFKIETYTKENILPEVIDKDFYDKVFLTVHDFGFYCTQHSNVIHLLEEEKIRDLYLIIIKTVFSYAEGEVFNFDGKLDFKITDPKNKYQFITGEFKWWSGINSFQDAFHQALRKHATGQESEIYILILSKNLNVFDVYEKIKNYINNEPEHVDVIDYNISPKGSKQLFMKHNVKVRGYTIPLIVGVINLYYQNL